MELLLANKQEGAAVTVGERGLERIPFFMKLLPLAYLFHDCFPHFALQRAVTAIIFDEHVEIFENCSGKELSVF